MSLLSPTVVKRPKSLAHLQGVTSHDPSVHLQPPNLYSTNFLPLSAFAPKPVWSFWPTFNAPITMFLPAPGPFKCSFLCLNPPFSPLELPPSPSQLLLLLHTYLILHFNFSGKTALLFLAPV